MNNDKSRIILILCIAIITMFMIDILVCKFMTKKEIDDFEKIEFEDDFYEEDKYVIDEIEDPILSYLNVVCNEYDLDVLYMLSIIQVESQFKKNAISYLGIDYGYGLMQVSKICLKDYNLWNGTNYTQKDLSNPYTNIMIGTWIYNQNKRYLKCNYDLDLLLSAYNIGARQTLRKGLNHSYVNKVHDARKNIDIKNIKFN